MEELLFGVESGLEPNAIDNNELRAGGDMDGSDAWPLGHPKSHMSPVPSFLVPSHSLEVRHDCQELGNSLSLSL